MKTKISLISGSSRQGNESIKVARYLNDLLTATSQVEIQFIDVGSLQLPGMEQRLGQWENPPQNLVEANEHIQESDCILIVAPEYKNSLPGTLKNFFDYLPGGVFRYKAIGIATVSSGAFGGINCLAQLRLICLAMGGMPIPDRLMVGQVKELFPDPSEEFRNRAERFLKEFLRYGNHLSSIPQE